MIFFFKSLNVSFKNKILTIFVFLKNFKLYIIKILIA